MKFLSFDVGTKNLSYCYLDITKETFQILDWSVDNVLPVDINVNTTPIADIAPHFYNYALNKSKIWLQKEIDFVFIENQPMGFRGGARNLKTKILSHILQVLLINQKPELKISFINPSLKLKDFNREKKSTYAQNKKFAIQKTIEILKSSECLNTDFCQNIIDKSKKKDDLADSFLQGLIAGRMNLNGDVIEVQVFKKNKTKKDKDVVPKAKKVRAKKSKIEEDI